MVLGSRVDGLVIGVKALGFIKSLPFNTLIGIRHECREFERKHHTVET